MWGERRGSEPGHRIVLDRAPAPDRAWALAGGSETITPGGTVTILRAGGATGYWGQVGRATWALPEVPREALAGQAGLWAPWPGHRAVVAVSMWQDATGGLAPGREG